MAANHQQLRDAAALISQPLLLEVLVATEAGRSPREGAPPDADPVLLGAAIDRLASIGAIDAGENADGTEPLSLTSRGEELLTLLHELAVDRPAR